VVDLLPEDRTDPDEERYHARLVRLGFRWTVEDVRREANRLLQPNQGPTGTASDMLNRWLIEDGFKQSD
jgi:hypothetical protein